MSDIVTLNGYKIKDEKAVRSYETVALMKADTKLKEGYHVKTKGYYEANDGGNGEYVIVDDDTLVDDGGSIHVLTNGLRAKLIINDVVDVKKFGAYGDNTHDDTLSLQTCLNFSFDNRLDVYIPDGTYLFSNLTFPTASAGDNEFAITIKGNSRQSTILKHTGTGIAINVSPRGESYCNGINMFNFNVSGNENTTIGINLPRGTRIKIDSVNVNLCNICVKNNNNFWLSSLTNMFLGPSGENSIGLEINGSSVTSIYYDEIYVYGSSKYAFHIEGTYSHIGILAADNCSGDYVYYFNYCSSGSIDTIASENANVTNIVKLRYSSLVIDNITAYNPNTETIQSVLNCESCKPSILTISVSASSEATIEKPLATLSFCNLTIDSISGNLHFNQATSTNNNDGVIVYNSLKIRGSSRPYIGNDRSVNTATTPYNSSNLGVAIFTDCTTSPSLGSDGTSYNWKTPAKQGDWFIENKPGEKNVAAYVLLEDGGTSQGINDAKRAPIPLILSGNTASRPSSYIRGGVYFDTTLGKPIWYTGSAWVDATGTQV